MTERERAYAANVLWQAYICNMNGKMASWEGFASCHRGIIALIEARPGMWR